MGADRIRLSPEAVHQHAATVQEICERMRETRAAAGHVSMDSQAYGQLCQFLPRALEPVFEAAVSAVAGSMDALQETAAHLRAVAVTVQATDQAAARRIDSASW